MFKFIREMSDAIKEGVAEAKTEMAEDKAADDRKTTEAEAAEQALIDATTDTVQFSVALGAPYREVYLGCIGIFGTRPVTPLFVIDFDENEHKDYAKLLSRDFNIVDGNSARDAVELFDLEINNGTGFAQIYRELKSNNVFDRLDSDDVAIVDSPYAKGAVDAVLDCERQFGLGESGGDAFRIAVASHICFGSAALGFLSHEEAVELFEPFRLRALSSYSDWTQYSAGFLAGQNAWGYQKFAGQKILEKAVKKLLSNEKSPWNVLGWGCCEP